MTTRKKPTVKPSDICVLCGENPARQGIGDHLPPKGIFPKSMRPSDEQFICVPACDTCNGGSSSDDEKFKVALGLQTSNQVESARRTFTDHIRPTLGMNSHQMLSLFDEQIKSCTESGASPSIMFDYDAIERVICRMVRGFHYAFTGDIVPKTSTISARLYLEPKYELISITALWDEFSMARKSFRCQFSIEDGDPARSGWLFEFFSSSWSFGCIR